MPMTVTNNRPTKGQYVVMWEFADTIWSCTVRYNEIGETEVYNEELDDWRVEQFCNLVPHNVPLQFMVPVSVSG